MKVELPSAPPAAKTAGCKDTLKALFRRQPGVGTPQNRFDDFYPPLGDVTPFQWIELKLKIQAHLEAAKAGDRESESALINRVGQVRRVCKTSDEIPADMRAAMSSACKFLISTGRRIDLTSTDPRYWISARSGGPRW